ncbi:NUDIX domain-containing protein [candidate division WS5 bacterium]|uniref:NUDIX domain-containing protein n=1 Tax=candidate division WS5 bacterium TaxID=2093353 RepID=A0A419DAZ8_9BACT|nr:MAG: NUDIX domain-containing protein [candidate division WS5 bacterium]
MEKIKRVRSVIIRDKKVLAIKRTKPEAIYWVIPGGGTKESETNEQALMREVREELGVDIKIKDLLLEMPSRKLETIGQKEYFYYCEILSGVLGSGQGPEFKRDSQYVGKYDIEWLDIANLNNFDLRPEEIKNLIYNRYK